MGDRYKMLFSWVFLVKSKNNLVCYEKKKVEMLGTSALFCYICTTFLNDNEPWKLYLGTIQAQTETRNIN